MSEINIARQLVEARHQKKITQEELASYIGVSKAAVSKWESGASFPDITLLPRLATYFNLSIDKLMGYEPQLTKEEIRRIYQELKELFVEKPFHEAMSICEEYEKKYYSCFPFLRQLVVLYTNHATLSKDPKSCYEHAAELARRVRLLSEDVYDVKDAAMMEVTLHMIQGEAMQALDLRGEEVHPMSQDTELLAQIYQSLGRAEEAKTTYQIAIYEHLVLLLGNMAPYLQLYAQDLERSEEIIKRGLELIASNQLGMLHSNATAIFYLTAAQVYCMHEMTEPALDMLSRYVKLCENVDWKIVLHGDAFFDRVQDWFQAFELGSQAPRSGVLIRQSMLSSVQDNPAFTFLHDNMKYQKLIEQLKKGV